MENLNPLAQNQGGENSAFKLLFALLHPFDCRRVGGLDFLSILSEIGNL